MNCRKVVMKLDKEVSGAVGGVACAGVLLEVDGGELVDSGAGRVSLGGRGEDSGVKMGAGRCCGGGGRVQRLGSRREIQAGRLSIEGRWVGVGVVGDSNVGGDCGASVLGGSRRMGKVVSSCRARNCLEWQSMRP